MNTIVFVLVVMTHSGNWVPTIEFSTLEKCQKATASFMVEADKHLVLGKPTPPWCWRVEK